MSERDLQSDSQRNSQSLDGCVQRVLWSSCQARVPTERRRGRRHPFPRRIYLTPVHPDRPNDPNATIVVLGKHISDRGLDFYSYQPLPFRRAVVSFPCADGEDIRLLMDLTWCRFCGHGWYENGGRFLHPMD